MLGVVILAALMTTIGTYIDKHLVNKGISRNDYFYYMCLSMIPFSIIMIVIEILTNNFKFEFSIIPIILLLLAMFVRYKKQQTIVGCLTHLTPYESVTYMSLGIILAFIIKSNEKKPKLLDVFAVFLVAVRYRITKYNIIR